MRSNKKSIFYLICTIFLFLLSGCTVIGNTSLPTFEPVDDSENVIAFYKGVRDYYSHNTGNCIVFFNTKTEKVTQEWDFDKAIEEYTCATISFADNKIINNEIIMYLDKRSYHIKKDTGKPFFLKEINLYDINSFIDNKILITENISNYIYDPKNSSFEETNFSSYSSNFFKIYDKYFYEYCGTIYSYETGKQVYQINDSNDDYYNQRIINNTNFYTISSSKEVTNENNEIIIKTKELKEIIINNDGDLDSITVINLSTNRDLLTVIKNSDTQITLFESDKNHYLYVTVYTKENGLWSQGIEKITKDDKIKISYPVSDDFQIKEHNDAYWLKSIDNNIIKINKTDFKVKEIEL
jgi:hypothetical protein